MNRRWRRILASIRKIISEDSSEAQPAPLEAKPAPAPAFAPRQPAGARRAADVLELTQEVPEKPPAPAPVHRPEPAPLPPRERCRVRNHRGACREQRTRTEHPRRHLLRQDPQGDGRHLRQHRSGVPRSRAARRRAGLRGRPDRCAHRGSRLRARRARGLRAGRQQMAGRPTPTPSSSA